MHFYKSGIIKNLNMCIVKTKSENQCFHYFLETKRDIAIFFADLKSLRSDNVVVE